MRADGFAGGRRAIPAADLSDLTGVDMDTLEALRAARADHPAPGRLFPFLAACKPFLPSRVSESAGVDTGCCASVRCGAQRDIIDQTVSSQRGRCRRGLERGSAPALSNWATLELHRDMRGGGFITGRGRGLSLMFNMKVRFPPGRH